jgi:hypothetical protein
MADQSPEKRQTVLRFNNGKLAGSKRPLINPQLPDDPARTPLEEIAKQMLKILPGLLLTRPDAQPRSMLYKRGNIPRLDVSYCPKNSPTVIKVVNADTIDAALQLAANSSSTCTGRSSLLSNLSLRHSQIQLLSFTRGRGYLLTARARYP